MSYEFNIKCNNCNVGYTIKYQTHEDVHTTYVVCPKCKKAIYAASDFGFGPVWPAHMYYGNCLLLTVDFFSDNRYEITFKSAPQTDIMIPKRSKKNNYKYHFNIMEHIHKKIQKLID